MSKLSVVLVSEDEIPAGNDTGTGLGAELQSVSSNLDKLSRAWPEVMQRLQEIVETGSGYGSASGFELDSIEFSVGIEGGLSIGISAKADASATISFKRRKPGAS